VQVLDELRKYFGEVEATKRQGWYDLAFVGEAHTVEEAVPVGDKIVYLEVHHKPVKNEYDQIVSISVSGRDISAYKYKQVQLEQSLQASQHEKETLAQQVEELKAQLLHSEK